MGGEQEHALRELGLPRANSNAFFVVALVILGCFAVMTYSCVRERKAHNDIESPPQPASGNEWFVGKAHGIEIPTPPPVSTPLPERIPRPAPSRVARGGSPAKKLGGKVFQAAAAAAQQPQERRQEPSDERFLDENDIAPFPPPPMYARAGGPRPDYYLPRDVEMPVSDFEVKAGTTIPAQLDMGLNSDLGGPAVAHVTRTIYDTVTGQFPLIPPGTKLYGNVDPRVGFGQERVDIVWERFIFPNGASLVVQNMRAADVTGQLGLTHTVDNHLDRLFGGAALLSTISAGIQLSQPQQSASFGASPSIGQTIAGALGQNLGQVSTEFFRRQMEVKPTIVIPNGEHFTVTVNKDMVFPGPYGAWE